MFQYAIAISRSGKKANNVVQRFTRVSITKSSAHLNWLT